jgi:hypothetical protein
MNHNNPLVQFFDAFMGRRNLSRKGKIIVIVVTVAIIASIIAAMHYNNMVIDDAYGSSDPLEDLADDMEDLMNTGSNRTESNNDDEVESFVLIKDDNGDILDVIEVREEITQGDKRSL